MCRQAKAHLQYGAQPFKQRFRCRCQQVTGPTEHNYRFAVRETNEKVVQRILGAYPKDCGMCRWKPIGQCVSVQTLTGKGQSPSGTLSSAYPAHTPNILACAFGNEMWRIPSGENRQGLKPTVTLFVSRQNINTDATLELRESFVPRIIESVEEKPF